MNTEQFRNEAQSDTPTLQRSLGFYGVLGQSIAGESPTATPTINVALVFVAAGTASWFVFLIATLAIILLATNIVPFARKVSGAGCLSTYVASGLGESWRIVTGWALLLAYIASGVAVLAAGAGYLTTVLSSCGLTVPLAWVVAIEGVVCAFLAMRNVRLSTGAMLGLETVSIVLVMLLCVAILYRQGLAVDLSQLQLKGMTAGGVSGGLLIALLAFAGFEEAAALGDEAREPHKTIPQVLFATPVFTGLFFIFTSYVLVLGFNRYGVNVATSQAPLDDLAHGIHRPGLGILIGLGAAISLFGCTLAAMVAGSRIAFSLAGRNALPVALAAIRPHTFIPGNAVITMVVIIVPAAIGFATRAKSLDIYNWFGTFAMFGFLAAYALTCLSAPFFLKHSGSLRPANIIASLGGLVILGFVFVSSVYPAQPAPMNWIPWLFLALTVIGTALSFLAMKR